ncbi:hypothetical protein K1719_028790 [Acacia pycnantha]|nr:hypothetical protein K1719_028790 [Acacia pycnantha]
MAMLLLSICYRKPCFVNGISYILNEGSGNSGEIMHDLRIIHTDLKPENILLVSSDYVKVPDYKSSSRSPSTCFKRVPKSSAIKVIDFGSTTYEREDQTHIVSTRHYRTPEVILGM